MGMPGTRFVDLKLPGWGSAPIILSQGIKHTGKQTKVLRFFKTGLSQVGTNRGLEYCTCSVEVRMLLQKEKQKINC